MYKKTLINLTAITLAMSIAFGGAVTTHAADPDTDTAISTGNSDGSSDATDSSNEVAYSYGTVSSEETTESEVRIPFIFAAFSVSDNNPQVTM